MLAKRLYFWTSVIVLLCAGLASSYLIDAGYRNIAYLYLERNDISAASTWFSRSPNPSLETRSGQVRTSVLLKNFDAAAKLSSASLYRPDLMSVWFLTTASNFLASGDPGSAISTLDLLNPSNNRDFEYWYFVGLLYERAGANDKARQVFEIGAGYDPAGELAQGWYYIARSFYNENKWQNVIDVLAPIYASLPAEDFNITFWPDTFYFFAYSQDKLGRLSEAEQTYRHIVAIDPSRRDWLIHLSERYLGYLELSRANWQAAQNDFVIEFDSAVTVPLKIYEERGWQDLLNLTDWIVSHGKSAEAISVVQRSIPNDPKSPGWRVLLGMLYEATCDPGKAREAFTVALDLTPGSLLIPAHLEALSNGMLQCLP